MIINKVHKLKSIVKYFIQKSPVANTVVVWVRNYVNMLLYYVKSFPSQLQNYFFIKHFYQKRFSNKYVGAIYNHAIGPFIMIAELQMRELYARNMDFYRDAVWIAGSKPANAQLQKMYKRTLPVVTNDKLHFSIINGGHRYLRKINRFIEDNYRNGMVFYPECPEFISFTDEETKYGYSLLEKIGIGKSDTYVTMHNKDNVYWKQRNGIEKSWDIYRDSEFSALKKSIEFLGDQDIKVIRSGHYEDEPERGYYSLNVLDSSEKDFMDIFIQKHCFFSVNGDSGIALIPYLFRKPILLHNAIPLGESPIVECGIVIPKIMKNAASGTILPISEILQKKVLLGYADRGRFCISSVSAEKFQNISHYQAHGIEIQDNTAEEILDGIKEMIAYVNGKFRLSEEQQKMQGRFRELFPVAHPMRHFIGYVSPSFLENYPEILN